MSMFHYYNTQLHSKITRGIESDETSITGYVSHGSLRMGITVIANDGLFAGVPRLSTFNFLFYVVTTSTHDFIRLWLHIN